MQKYLEMLKNCPLFAGIEEESLLRMLHCLGARVEHFDKKYTVFSEGTPARYVGILLSGSLQMSRVDYYGNRSILGNVKQGELFCEAFACASVEAMPISVVAIEESEVMLVDCSHILHTCQNACGFHHQMIYNLMRDLAEKNLVFHQRAEVTSKRSTREKLMAYLLLCAKEAGSNRFTVPFDRQELADYLEVDRSGLSAEISKLRREGILESDKQRFHLL